MTFTWLFLRSCPTSPGAREEVRNLAARKTLSQPGTLRISTPLQPSVSCGVHYWKTYLPIAGGITGGRGQPPPAHSETYKPTKSWGWKRVSFPRMHAPSYNVPEKRTYKPQNGPHLSRFLMLLGKRGGTMRVRDVLRSTGSTVFFVHLHGLPPPPCCDARHWPLTFHLPTENCRFPKKTQISLFCIILYYIICIILFKTNTMRKCRSTILFNFIPRSKPKAQIRWNSQLVDDWCLISFWFDFVFTLSLGMSRKSDENSDSDLDSIIN